MKQIKVMTVFGTRPEAIKMAPLVHALEQAEGIESIVCVTAQHREMLDQVMEIFHLKADYDLNIMQPRQTLASITTRSLNGLDEVLEQAKPDLVLVHGDTSTTFAGALAAFYHKIPVGHVEAGLRTFDKYSPFPEEINRKLTGQIASLHFAPTERNRRNLAAEGITEGVLVCGNTVVDAIHTTVRPEYTFRDEKLNTLEYDKRRVLLVTAHRRENYGEAMENIMRALRRLADRYEDVDIVYPVHLSPYVRETAAKYLSGHERIHLIEPLAVDEMHNLMQRCELVLTDSGGLQEEAPSLGKPVLVLRRETERPEAVEAGTVRMAGVEEETIYSMACTLLDDPEEYAKMAHAVNPYGDGQTSRRIVQAIRCYFGQSEDMPDEFKPETVPEDER
ncbi:MAG: non-hydrolyzing UDP-N-acetylglucosamine 2-epimerase [Butyricicoccus sp.]